MTLPSPVFKIPLEIEAEMTPAVRAFFDVLIAGFSTHLALVQADFEARIAGLEDRLQKLTPQNSSLPPSSVHPHGKPIPKKPKSQRKRGGQSGHQRHERALVPSEQCNEIVTLVPQTCRRCCHPLIGLDPLPLRHQVFEIPPIVASITEYQRHRLTCTMCGTRTCGALAVGVPTGQSGPRLIAFTALLMGHFRQSKRLASEFLQDLLNLPCCPSLTVKMQSLASSALADPHEELRQALAGQFNVHMDETPTNEANRKAWLWTAVAKNFVVFAVFGTRAATAITALLGIDFKGIINCDRAKMYYIASNLQWCWAHLIRDIQGMIDSKVPERVELGNSLMDQLRAMFLQWHRYKADEIDWKEFQVNAIPIATRVNQLLYMGSGCHDSKVRNQCKSLHAHSNKLWIFISNQGIEPTNNAAERQLRHAVIYRKLSFGTQSQSGSRFIERIFSVAATCRIQKRNAFEFIVESVQAKLCNRDAPKLLTP